MKSLRACKYIDEDKQINLSCHYKNVIYAIKALLNELLAEFRTSLIRVENIKSNYDRL